MNKQERSARILAINEEMRNIQSLIETEKRGMTEEESANISALTVEARSLDLENKIEFLNKIKTIPSADFTEMSRRSSDLAFAEAAVASMSNHEPIQARAAAVQDLSSASNLVPLTIGDIIEPLEKGLILDKVGVKIQTGLVGDWKYPVLSAVEATIAGESVEVADSKIDIAAVKPVPHRVTLSAFVTNTAMNQTNEELKAIILNQMNKGLQRTLNKWMFSTTQVASGCAGPFVAPSTTMDYTTAVTYADVQSLRGTVDSKGVSPDGTEGYVMNNAMAATLRATPTDTGSGRFIIENGKIDGIPVFVTEYVDADTILFGYFGYELVGQFGDLNIIVDPYTGAKKNGVYFILNTDFDMKEARPEAFGILKKQTV